MSEHTKVRLPAMVVLYGANSCAVFPDDSDRAKVKDRIAGPFPRTPEGIALATAIADAPKLVAALRGLMPEGWDDDDTMDHMPGIKAARLLLAKHEPKAPA